MSEEHETDSGDGGRAFRSHDHRDCVNAALENARETCAARRLRLTSVRARVLEILLESHRALGAYEVLQRLSAEGFGTQPPVAYRALEFLVSNGFAHRIERLNAFVACAHPGSGHEPAFLICTGCGRVGEQALSTRAGPFGALAEAAGFDLRDTVVEAEGLCPGCQEKAAG